MKNGCLLSVALTCTLSLFAQGDAQKISFVDVKTVKTTSVKDQAATGTCWSFSATSMMESEEIRKSNKEVDLSEMFTVRNNYIEKAKNYILRMGNTQFGEGGLGHDLVRSIELYGAVPEAAYSGLVNGARRYNHGELFRALKTYLDGVLQKKPVDQNWLDGYTKLLDQYMGAAPATFIYEGQQYTPKTFAKLVLNYAADDYVSLTSFTHVPYYQSFVLQVPDNYSNGQFYNLPLNEIIETVKAAISKGYSVTWDADVSNNGFQQQLGFALNLNQQAKYTREQISPDMKEEPYDAGTRQLLYENLTTQDDHLMHLVGVQKAKNGKAFFLVKNSWGLVGPFNGYINVSEPYFAINTISIVVPKAALSPEVKAKLKL